MTSGVGVCLHAEMEETLQELEERTETVTKLSQQLGVISQDNKSLKQRAHQVTAPSDNIQYIYAYKPIEIQLVVSYILVFYECFAAS